MSFFPSLRANPGVALAIFRELARRGEPTERVALLSAVAPPDGYDGRSGNALDETLGVGLDIGLFESRAGRITVGPHGKADPDISPVEFRTLVRRQLLASAGDQWESNDRGHDLVRALVWFLAQDPIYPMVEWERIERTLDTDLGFQGRVIQNSDQWRHFLRWATFIGLAARFAQSGRGRTPDAYLPDPTVALLDELPALFTRELGPTGAIAQAPARVAARTFVSRAVDHLPVLDASPARLELERRRKVAASADGTASPCLSLALMALEQRRIIQLANPADAPADVRLVLQLGRERRTVSYVDLAEA